MSKAKELMESLKTLPEGMLPKAEEPAAPFDESEIEGVEISETEDKDYHVKQVKTQHGDTEHQVFHKDKHIGSVKGQLMWVKKNGKMTGGHNVGTVENGVNVLKKYHKAGKID